MQQAQNRRGCSPAGNGQVVAAGGGGGKENTSPPTIQDSISADRNVAMRSAAGGQPNAATGPHPRAAAPARCTKRPRLGPESSGPTGSNTVPDGAPPTSCSRPAAAATAAVPPPPAAGGTAATAAPSGALLRLVLARPAATKPVVRKWKVIDLVSDSDSDSDSHPAATSRDEPAVPVGDAADNAASAAVTTTTATVAAAAAAATTATAAGVLGAVRRDEELHVLGTTLAAPGPPAHPTGHGAGGAVHPPPPPPLAVALPLTLDAGLTRPQVAVAVPQPQPHPEQPLAVEPPSQATPHQQQQLQVHSFQQAPPDVLAALACFAVQLARTAPAPVAPGSGLPRVAAAGAVSVAGSAAAAVPAAASGRIKTAEELQTWLDRNEAAADAALMRDDGDGMAAAAQLPPVVLDLKGNHLRGLGIWKLRVFGGGGAALVIRNGSIGGIGGVLVEGGADVTFQDMTFTAAVPPAAAATAGGAGGSGAQQQQQWQQQPWDALVVVRGAGSRARLDKCTVKFEKPLEAATAAANSLAAAATAAEATTSRVGCVLALAGGSVELSGHCKLLCGPCFGLAALGPDSTARAELAEAVQAGTSGFLAAYDGQLTALKCIATDSGGNSGVSGRNLLVTADGAGLMGLGFAAVDGGRMATTQCFATRCAYSGFLAWGTGAELASSGGCFAEANNWAGFLAARNAALRAGRGCRALSNRNLGFAADAGGSLAAAEGCLAEDNGAHGWCAAGEGALLVAGGRCRALRNRGGGFMAVRDALLFAGEGCVAEGNAGDGWAALDSAQMVAGAGCRAEGNDSRGFLAVTGARVVLGPDCEACRNGGDGLAAVQYGKSYAGGP